MDKQTFISGISGAMAGGKFLTPKHDPNGPAIMGSYRTVLSLPVSASLDSLMQSGAYQINHYIDQSYPQSIGTFELILHDSGSFPYVGTELLPLTAIPSKQMDRLLVVSGSGGSGWHIFAEDSIEIQRKRNAGQYTLVATY